MDNVAEVIFKGTDQTSPVARRVAQNLRGTREEMGALSKAFDKTSAATGAFGKSFKDAAGAIGAVTGLMNGMRFTAVGLAATMASAGTTIATQFFEKIEEKAKSAQTGWDAFTDAVRRRRDILEPGKVAERAINERASAEIDKIRASSMERLQKREAEQQVKITRDLELQKLKEKEATEQKLAAQELVRQKNEENWAIYEAILEVQKTREKEIADAQITREEENWETYEAILEQKLAREKELAQQRAQLEEEAQENIRENDEYRRFAHEREMQRWNQQLNTVAHYTSGAASALGQLASAMEAGSKKQFKTAQALRIGEAIMNTAAGIARCYADYPLWLAIPMSAIVAAAGAVQIGVISKQSGPQAHSGLDYVPQEATYKLSRGEMVLDPGTSDAVRQAAINGSGGGGGQTIIVQVDGEELFRAINRGSRNGRLVISAKAIA